MKASEAIRAKSPLHTLYALYVIPLCIMLTNMIEACDTASYYTAWQTLKGGGFDIFRTPLYPFILGVIQDVGGKSLYLFLTVLLQAAVFGVSIKYFYRIVEMLTRPGKIPFVVTLWYIFSPSTSMWASVLLTESLSISLMTMWIYTLLKIYRREGGKGVYYVSMCLLCAMYMLRPSFVYLSVVSVIFCASVIICDRHKARIGLLAMSQLVPLVMILGYCCVFKAVYGVFTPSSVSMINQMAIFRINGNTFDSCTDPRLKADITHYLTRDDYEMNSCFMEILDKHSLVAIDHAIKDEIAADRIGYLAKAGGRLYQMYQKSDTTGYLNPAPVMTVLGLIAFNGKDLIIMTLIGMAYLLVLVVRRRRFVFLMVLMSIVAGTIATSVLGAQAEWVRLSTCAVPILMIVTGMIASNFRLVPRD